MRRLFYLSLGAVAGAYASHRLHRAARAWTPAGLADSAAGVSASLREAVHEVRVRATEREGQLRGELGLNEPTDMHVDERTRETH